VIGNGRLGAALQIEDFYIHTVIVESGALVAQRPELPIVPSDLVFSVKMTDTLTATVGSRTGTWAVRLEDIDENGEIQLGPIPERVILDAARLPLEIDGAISGAPPGGTGWGGDGFRPRSPTDCSPFFSPWWHEEGVMRLEVFVTSTKSMKTALVYSGVDGGSEGALDHNGEVATDIIQRYELDNERLYNELLWEHMPDGVDTTSTGRYDFVPELRATIDTQARTIQYELKGKFGFLGAAEDYPDRDSTLRLIETILS
jgi:hypothetical protein